MKCDRCSNELIEYRCGNNTEYICPVCDETPITQTENLIEYDPNMYTMTILTVKDYDKSMLKEIGEICGCNVLEACTLRGWIVNRIDVQNQLDLYASSQEDVQFD